MNQHVAKLVRAFAALPVDFAPEDLERAITGTLKGLPLGEWEQIAAIIARFFKVKAEDLT